MSNAQLGAEEIKVQRAPKPSGLPETVRIILDEDENIPPTGLFLGLNGKGYMISPGVEVDVPLGILDILDHAIISVPVKDNQTNRFIGARDRIRYSYRRVS